MTDPYFLQNVQKQFQYYKLLAEQTMDLVNEQELFWEYNKQSNSIAIIAKHISGNAISRWTDFLHSDGEKDWRNRDQEFEMDFNNRKELLEYWEKGWACLFDALNSMTNEDLERIISIRNMGHTVIEAINRQLAHYSYHVGQIVFIGKMICGEKWQSLSIPKGDSNRYNTSKFAQGKDRIHFSDEFLKGKIL